jgi:drug/metabolite transporter (DMT)-like permease
LTEKQIYDGGMVAKSAGDRVWMRSMPLLFVFLWSTGFIATKLGLPYAPPVTFLILRFAVVVVLMLPIAILFRAPWPNSPQQVAHIAVAGALLHGGYLVGVFGSIHFGMSAGLVALIVGLQPILTAFAAVPLLGEHVSRRQWLGLLLGLGGVVLVVLQKISLSGLSALSIGMALIALVSITIGTVYQKRFCAPFDLRSGSVIQFVAAGLALLPFGLALETMRVEWTPDFVFALAWLALVLSIGAISLLTLLIRRGAATTVASLFYLTPPTTAVMAYLLFGETLTGIAMVGMVLAIAGVALVAAGPRPR